MRGCLGGCVGLATRSSRSWIVAVAISGVACAAGVEGTPITGTFGSSASATTPVESDTDSSSSTGVPTSSISESAEGETGESGIVESTSGSSGSATTSVPGECGDGAVSTGEDCDGEDFAGQTCADFGFDDGILLCNPECNLITEGCRTCGDDMLSMAELCDGSQLGGETCMTQGYGGGTLTCSADCSALDASACTPLPTCGDGVRNGAEQCDGADLAGSSCEALGFDFGVLACNAGACTYNTGSCEYLDCGGMGDFCLFDEENPQSTCCPPGVGGNVFGLCAFFVCQ